MTGFTLVIAAGIDEAVLDIGLAASTRGNRAFLPSREWLTQACISLTAKKSPSEDRVNGEHINEKLAGAVEKTRTKIEGAMS